MGSKIEGLELVKDGMRANGRKIDQLKDVKMQVGILKRADGSAYVEQGSNKVIAAVYGPRECLPRHTQNPLKAKLTYRYNMAPFSVSDRIRPGPNRRGTEISKVSREALEKVVFTEYFPKTSIDVFVEILQADAGTRCVALTAASLALADAGIPMRSLISSCSAGKVDGTVVLDLDGPEDMHGEADLPITERTAREQLSLPMFAELTEQQVYRVTEVVADWHDQTKSRSGYA